MKKIFYLFPIICILGIFVTSCDTITDKTKLEIINVTNDINNNTTWESDKVYLIQNKDLQIKATLTISSGAIIKFANKEGNITVRQNGKIIAHGTSTSPIVFTSYKDDNNGGDSDGDIANPAVGDWGTITIVESTGSEFYYCNFLYGGYYRNTTSNPTLDISSSSSATVSNCKFENNGGGLNAGNYIGALQTSWALNSTEINNTSFKNNTLPLSINAELSINNSNSFSNNTYNGIFVDGMYITKNTSWLETEVAFVITSSNFTVNQNAKLTLGNSVVLKFLKDGMLSLNDGESALINHDATGVFFTSFKDDTHGGDSNGNG
ncbi:MAG: hypothetical protein LBV69_07665, partial [Bacteroidales bacterium]|nr:hypothetical protein [Bacteroidales bacterium]